MFQFFHYYILKKGRTVIDDPPFISFNSNTLCQVSWLVNVLTFANGNMICQQLQRNGCNQWLQTLHHIVSSAIFEMVSSPFETSAITLP